MDSASKIQSVTNQILEDFFRRLEKDSAIPPRLVSELRRLASKGKMTSSEAILAALTNEDGG
jgi:hypothetical protein